MKIFMNPWFVGIAGSVFSSFFVLFITRVFKYKKDNREYLQKVINANHEILCALRPSLAEGFFPTKEIFESLINAISKKNEINPSDIYSIQEVKDLLVKEIMDSSFVQTSNKLELCEKIKTISSQTITKQDDQHEYNCNLFVAMLLKFRQQNQIFIINYILLISALSLSCSFWSIKKMLIVHTDLIFRVRYFSVMFFLCLVSCIINYKYTSKLLGLLEKKMFLRTLKSLNIKIDANDIP